MKCTVQSCIQVRVLSFLLALVFAAAFSEARAASGLLYVLNDNTTANMIYGYSVTENTGQLSLLPGFPLATGGKGDADDVVQRLVIDSVNNRLYAMNFGSLTVSAYSINPATGALAALPFSPIAVVGGAGTRLTLAIHPSGSPLIVSDATGKLSSFNITATSAVQATGSPFSTGTATPFSTAFSQDGNFVYTGGNTGTVFAGFNASASTGVLTALPGSPFDSTATGPVGYATDGSGRLFMVNASGGGLRVFATANGVPTADGGNPFATGLTEPLNGILHPNGYYIVADFIGNKVGVYKVAGSATATTLTAVAGSPFATGGTAANCLALNQFGNALFVSNAASRNLTSFNVNPDTGVLSVPVTQPANALGAAGSVTGMGYLPSAASGGLLYVLNDQAAGPAPGVTASTNMGSGFSTNLQVTVNGTGLSSFSLSATHASATATNSWVSTSGTLTGNVTFDLHGSYGLNGFSFWNQDAGGPGAGGSSGIKGVTIQSSTDGVNFVTIPGAPTQFNQVTTAVPFPPQLVTFPPVTTSFVRFVITSNWGDPAQTAFCGVLFNGGGNQIHAYSVNEASGALAPVSGYPIPAGGSGDGIISYITQRMALDPVNGRLYVLNTNSSTVTAYSIDPRTSRLTPLPFTIALTPGGTWAGLAVHPSGSPLVVGNGTTSKVESYVITATSATAAPGSPYTTGAATPMSMVFTPDGNFVYTGGLSGAVTSFAGFSVTASTGALAALTGSPFASGGPDPDGYVIDAAGRLFLANYSATTLRVFTLSAGIPSAVTGSPFTSGIATGNYSILHPNGFLMIGDVNANLVGVYQIGGSGSATTLGAVPGSPFAAGGLSTGPMVLNGAGTFLFAANETSRNMSTFDVNPATGFLSAPLVQNADALGGAGTTPGMVYVAQPPPISFGSGPTATPNPAGVGQTVSFSSAATGGFGALTYSWNFGDGSPAAPGASVTHAYAVAGTYTATVTATDVLNVSSTANVSVIVNGPVVGTGPDSDGDGFSDSFETAVGTNPNDATDTPTGAPATAGAVQTLSITKVSIKLNFAKPTLNDSISFSGAVIVPEGFHPAVSKVFIDVGGVAKHFLLDVTGAAVSADKKDSIKISIKTVSGAAFLQTAKYTATFKKGSFAASLADEGLTSTTVKNSAKQVLFTLIFNNTIMQKLKTVSYTATAGKSGSAK
ncbi:MAG TPA: PKD domain-containing protein [Planctomycetota bacterium]|nr:PKD domain-containing protein [Planctomycetota bacterium]